MKSARDRESARACEDKKVQVYTELVHYLTRYDQGGYIHITSLLGWTSDQKYSSNYSSRPIVNLSQL